MVLNESPYSGFFYKLLLLSSVLMRETAAGHIKRDAFDYSFLKRRIFHLIFLLPVVIGGALAVP